VIIRWEFTIELESNIVKKVEQWVHMAQPLEFHECDHIESLEHAELSFWKLSHHQDLVTFSNS